MNEKKVESKLKTHNPGECQVRFPELEMKSISDLEDSFTGAIVGRVLCHAWFDVDFREEKTVYDGNVEKWKGLSEFGADLVSRDLIMSYLKIN